MDPGSLDHCQSLIYNTLDGSNRLDIQDLVWDEVNEAHIWNKHQISKAEVEEVCYGREMR